MKPSSALFLFVTVILCFAIGFGIGAFPERWQKLNGREPQSLQILISDPKLLPDSFLVDYERASGVSVKIKAIESFHLFRTEAQQADLLLAPLAWLDQFPEALRALPESKGPLKALLASDFQSLQLNLNEFLPTLWRVEKKDRENHLLIWGFAIPQNSPHEVGDLLQFLLNNEDRLKLWSQATGMASTLQLSNQVKDFPPPFQAARIRDVSLSKLVIDQKKP